MSQNESVQAFLRSFGAGFDIFLKKFDRLLIVLIQNKHEDKVAAATELIVAVEDLNAY